MVEAAVGLILATLDVDVDNGAAWNRWYDLEHLAPNIALPGISTGRRYVAAPELHRMRIADPDDPAWRPGRSVYLTWYATTVDPGEAIAEMTSRRDELDAEGRMDGAGARVVRTGDALDLVEVVSDPALRLDERDLVHVGHAGLRLLVDTEARSPTLVPGVIASLRFSSRFIAGTRVELQLLERCAFDALPAIRELDPRPQASVDAGYDPITPLHYPFLDAIMASDLPRTIED